MPWWIILMLIVYTFACVFLIFIILIQSGSKGGGLSSLGSGSQGLSDALGATGAEKTLNKMTTISAVLFFILAILLSCGIKNEAENAGNILQDQPQSGTVTGTQPQTGVGTTESPAVQTPAEQQSVPTPTDGQQEIDMFDPSVQPEGAEGLIETAPATDLPDAMAEEQAEEQPAATPVGE